MAHAVEAVVGKWKRERKLGRDKHGWGQLHGLCGRNRQEQKEGRGHGDGWLMFGVVGNGTMVANGTMVLGQC